MVALDPVLTAEDDDKDVALAVLDPVAVLEAVADEVADDKVDALLLAVPVLRFVAGELRRLPFIGRFVPLRALPVHQR